MAVLQLPPTTNPFSTVLFSLVTQSFETPNKKANKTDAPPKRVPNKARQSIRKKRTKRNISLNTPNGIQNAEGLYQQKFTHAYNRTTMGKPSYFVTGANSGCGLESTRQLAFRILRQRNGNGTSSIDEGPTTIYLLCRSEEKASAAIQDIHTSIAESRYTIHEVSNRLRLEFIRFDACGEPETIRNDIDAGLAACTSDGGDEDGPLTIGGILLNAGGFGDGNKDRDGNNHKDNHKEPAGGNSNEKKACSIARLNILGHVILVNHLLSVGTALRCDGGGVDDDEGPAADTNDTTQTTIVAVGSEASFASPGVRLDYRAADFVRHLEGTAPHGDRAMGMDYGWTKGILALFWAAYARRHPNGPCVLVVSPGAVAGTNLLHQGSVSPLLRGLAKLTQARCFGGSHTVREGAKRCVDALLVSSGGFGTDKTTGPHPAPTGSFLASRKGFTRDYGDVAILEKGKFVADAGLQDKAWDAVHEFL